MTKNFLIQYIAVGSVCNSRKHTVVEIYVSGYAHLTLILYYIIADHGFADGTGPLCCMQGLSNNIGLGFGNNNKNLCHFLWITVFKHQHTKLIDIIACKRLLKAVQYSERNIFTVMIISITWWFYVKLKH